MKPDEPCTYEYMGWHVICTPQDHGWWRLRAECPAENPPLTATIYDSSLEAAIALMTAHINDTIDGILCTA